MKDEITDEFYLGFWDCVIIGGGIAFAIGVIYLISYLATLS